MLCGGKAQEEKQADLPAEKLKLTLMVSVSFLQKKLSSLHLTCAFDTVILVI
jgi:hypothetical protein